MQRTSIEWTDFSVTPLKMQLPDGTRINACVHKSRGCEKCYAEAIVRRWWKKEWGTFPGYTPALLKFGTPALVEDELKAVIRLSERIAKGKADANINKIFWNDMTDEYLDFWPDETLDKIWAVRALTPNLIHQVLTKRAERMYDYFRSFHQAGAAGRALSTCAWIDRLTRFSIDVGTALERIPVGLSNVHLGVSVEDQKAADERIPRLLKTPAAVRWVSYEPALGPVDFRVNHPHQKANGDFRPLIDDLDWIVVGGESGPGARPFDIQWALDVIAQCKAAGVACFIKQLGRQPYDGDTECHVDSSLHLKDKKGGSMEEWPEALRIRETV